MRIAIVCFQYGIAHGSLTSSLPRMLAEAGHPVDIYMDEIAHDHCASNFDYPGVTPHILTPPSKKTKLYPLIALLTRFNDQFISRFPLRIRYQVAFSLKRMAIASMLKDRMIADPPDIIIAYDIRSLAALFWNDEIPIIYIDLELVSYNTNTKLWPFLHKYLFKTIERDMLPKLAGVYVPSPLRGHIFARDNNYPEELVRTLPVVPQGWEQARSNNFFRNKFSLAPDIRIVLHAGHLRHWSLIHEIIPTVAHWPEKTAFVIHTWDKQHVSTDYLEHLTALAQGLPVFFSFESIPKDETCAAWASADIGVAFYKAIDDNFTEILFSSNKFGDYMKAGLPVICSNFASLKEFVDVHGIGKAVPAADCAAAVTDICNKYDDYAVAVKRCHQQYFVLERYVEPLLEDMKNIMSMKDNIS